MSLYWNSQRGDLCLNPEKLIVHSLAISSRTPKSVSKHHTILYHFSRFVTIMIYFILYIVYIYIAISKQLIWPPTSGFLTPSLSTTRETLYWALLASFCDRFHIVHSWKQTIFWNDSIMLLLPTNHRHISTDPYAITKTGWWLSHPSEKY